MNVYVDRHNFNSKIMFTNYLKEQKKVYFYFII